MGVTQTMKGNKHTFIESGIFHKEYNQQEFTFLKLLHGNTNLPIDSIMHKNKHYITMPEGHVISIDTIPKEDRSSLSHLITKNLPFMLEQISYLQNLNIYYSDMLQWLLYNNKMYLIDFDTAYLGVDYDHNNFNLLTIFLSDFDVNSSFITESLNYLRLFQKGTNILTSPEETEIYNKYNNPTIKKNHIYYTYNRRHIQIKHIPSINIYGSTGNMVITETLLNPETRSEWELVKII